MKPFLPLTSSATAAALLLLTSLDYQITSVQAKSKKDDKEDEGFLNRNGNLGDLSTIPFDSRCGSAVAGGCIVASGEQVVQSEDADNNQIASDAEFARLSFEFDAGFTELTYTSEVYGPEFAPTTSYVMAGGLVCGAVGEEILDANLPGLTIVDIMHNVNGAPFDGVIQPFILNPVNCGSTRVNTIAALYQAMLEEQIFYYIQTKDFRDGTDRFIRGQAFLPQGGYKLGKGGSWM